MNNWENAVITAKGISLLAKLISGETLNITRGETGSGYVTPGILQNQEAVTSPMQQVSFREVSYTEDGMCALMCFITNDGVNAAYTANQIGIYATDPDEGEILFFITQATSGKGMDIPSESEMPGYSSEWTFHFKYGQAGSVSVVVDPSNTVSSEEMKVYVGGQIREHAPQKGSSATDSTAAHIKNVPTDAAPYAEVVEIGGFTKKCTNLIAFSDKTLSFNGVDVEVKDSVIKITGTGSSSGGRTNRLSDDFILPEGTYYFGVAYSAFGMDTFISKTDNTILSNSNRSFTITETTTCYVSFNIAGGTVYNQEVCMMLTPGTSPQPFEPYFDGLRSAPVTGVESVGVNLTTAKAVYEGTNGYAELVVDGRNCIRFTSASSIRNAPITFEPNTQYTVSFYAKGENFGGATTQNSVFAFFYEDGTYTECVVEVNAPWTLFTLTSTIGKTIKYIGVFSREYRAYVYLDTDTFMLNEGTTAKPYTPYTRNTLPIPAEVQALDGYGWGITDTVYNYIDWEEKQFVKRVGRVDLGSLNWTAGAGNWWTRELAGIAVPNTGLCDNYTVIPTTAIGLSANKTIQIRADIMYVVDLDASTEGDITGTLYYELVTPIITDISDLLPADNLIGVEAGGTVTMVNEYGYDVPNTITFYEGKNEVVGADTFVGNLQGTAKRAEVAMDVPAWAKEPNPPTPAEIGAIAMFTTSKRLELPGWYRVGTLSMGVLHTAAVRLITGGQFNHSAHRTQIVDISVDYVAGYITKAVDTVNASNVTKVRLYRLNATDVAIDIYYATTGGNNVRVYVEQLFGSFATSPLDDVTSLSGTILAELDLSECANPPMELGVEYRTTERIQGKAVYKKNDNGIIKYRLDGETEWKNYATLHAKSETLKFIFEDDTTATIEVLVK